MKTTDSRDPLDRSIDRLLSSRPVRPNADFVDRVMDAADPEPVERTGPVAIFSTRRLLQITMPVAAAIAIAFVAASQLRNGDSPVLDLMVANENGLTAFDIEEILLLEEGLSGFDSLGDSEAPSATFLEALAADLPITES